MAVDSGTTAEIAQQLQQAGAAAEAKQLPPHQPAPGGRLVVDTPSQGGVPVHGSQ